MQPSATSLACCTALLWDRCPCECPGQGHDLGWNDRPHGAGGGPGHVARPPQGPGHWVDPRGSFGHASAEARVDGEATLANEWVACCSLMSYRERLGRRWRARSCRGPSSPTRGLVGPAFLEDLGRAVRCRGWRTVWAGRKGFRPVPLLEDPQVPIPSADSSQWWMRKSLLFVPKAAWS